MPQLSGACVVTPGVDLATDQTITNSVLNQLAQPTVNVAANAITSVELSPNLNLTKFATNLDINSKIAPSNLESTALSSVDPILNTNRSVGDMLQADGSGGVEWFTPTTDSLTIPVGTVVMLASGLPPVGWMLCDGSAISRTTYSTLFAACNTIFGPGDGITTFNLPNTQAVGIVGAGVQSPYTTKTLGQTGGTENITLTTNTMPSHTHGMGCSPYSGQHQNGVQPSGVYPMVTGETDQQTESTGGGQPFSILNPFLCLNFMIKVQ